MTVSLSNLEKLANDAKSKSDFYSHEYVNMEIACSPEVILKLVMIAQTAKDLVEGLRNSECRKVSEYCCKCADALEWIEP